MGGLGRDGAGVGGNLGFGVGGAHEAVVFRRKIFQFLRQTYSQDGRYDNCVNTTLR